MHGNLIDKLQKLIQEKNVKFVDLRLTDPKGGFHHITISANSLKDPEFLKEGKSFDGSSIAGFKDIHSSDMLLLPDLTTAKMDPFFDESTLFFICDVMEPTTMQAYERDPRALAKRAENYLKTTGIADTFYVGPEIEFFILDDVRWKISMDQAFYKVDSKEANWNNETIYDEGNHGHRPHIKGGYFPVPPVDSSQNIRSAICLILEQMGFAIETHHHEVASCNQNEINLRFNSLLPKADEVQLFKYVVRNVAHAYGKTATFMPKPLLNDNGSGMHCHQSLFKEGQNLFAGDRYSGLSELALYYIGGIIKHARALNAFTNPTTNSYKRLVPGYEAPVLLAYSACNRSAAIRIPFVSNPKARRIEVRFPDPLANPYLAFSAMLLAGLDGIKNKIHPGEAKDADLYHLSEMEESKIPTVSATLYDALLALKADCDFLKVGGVFTQDVIDSYIRLKLEEVKTLRTTTHPVEFEMYYSS